jgi:hypothetical protein
LSRIPAVAFLAAAMAVVALSSPAPLAAQSGPSDEFNKLAELARFDVAILEENYFAEEGSYTESYDALKALGLVAYPGICYGAITVFAFTAADIPAYKFTVRHKDPSAATISYDSSEYGESAKVVVPNGPQITCAFGGE